MDHADCGHYKKAMTRQPWDWPPEHGRRRPPIDVTIREIRRPAIGLLSFVLFNGVAMVILLGFFWPAMIVLCAMAGIASAGRHAERDWRGGDLGRHGGAQTAGGGAILVHPVTHQRRPARCSFVSRITTPAAWRCY
jgi:hypothetical protein